MNRVGRKRAHPLNLVNRVRSGDAVFRAPPIGEAHLGPLRFAPERARFASLFSLESSRGDRIENLNTTPEVGPGVGVAQ